METSTLHLSTKHRIDTVDPRLFGGFLEHMGRAVYEGVYEPSSKHADEHGFRTDVLEALRELDLSVVRYPGGNFVSGYHWEDGVGPREQRPTVRERAWNAVEPNEFGTHEFMQLCAMLGWEPMLAVNLGTGTPEEAARWVDYCNGAPGTRDADMRVANGRREPYGVRLWCLGNEMDGPWQLGHVPADQYAIRAQQAAKLMRDTDPGIELVASGSCATFLPTYIEWDRTVLEYLGRDANYISMHRYVDNRADDTPDFLAITASIDRQIEDMDAVCRYVQARKQAPGRPHLCFDEWNVWYKTQTGDFANSGGRTAAPLIEEIYNLEDALVAAGFLNSFIRHADCVKIANIAQIVNVIAPILTRGDELLLQSIHDVFRMFSTRRTGISLDGVMEGPRYVGQRNGEVPYVDHSVILDGSRMHVFLVNRHLSEATEVRVALSGARVTGLESAERLAGDDPKAANTFEDPDQLRAVTCDPLVLREGDAWIELPPLSVTAATLSLG
jgi:alpha-N-arabinofuranosidase